MPIFMDFGRPIDKFCEVTGARFGDNAGSFKIGRSVLTDQLFLCVSRGTNLGTVSVEYQRPDGAVFTTLTLIDVVVDAAMSGSKEWSCGLAYTRKKINVDD